LVRELNLERQLQKKNYFGRMEMRLLTEQLYITATNGPLVRNHVSNGLIDYNTNITELANGLWNEIRLRLWHQT
jgi:hypothetical protein